MNLQEPLIVYPAKGIDSEMARTITRDLKHQQDHYLTRVCNG